jgi:uncharacterized protein YciU (UPF0263 family)
LLKVVLNAINKQTDKQRDVFAKLFISYKFSNQQKYMT